jgi:hypothetical protein
VREFKDDEGRPWRLALTVGSALRVRDMVTVEIAEIDDEGKPTGSRRTVPFDIVDLGTIAQTFQVLRGQFAKLGEILYALLVRQCEERKLDREQFLEGLRGDALEAAAKALEEELVDFFPLRLRRTLALLAAKMDEATSELMDQAEAGLEKLTPADLPGMQSGKPPESSASTPETGPSDSSSPPAKPASSTTGGTPQT